MTFHLELNMFFILLIFCCMWRILHVSAVTIAAGWIVMKCGSNNKLTLWRTNRIRGNRFLIQHLPGPRVSGSSWLDSLWPTAAAGSQSAEAVGWWSQPPGGGWFPWRHWWCLGGWPDKGASWGCVQASATEEQTLWSETSSLEFIIECVATSSVWVTLSRICGAVMLYRMWRYSGKPGRFRGNQSAGRTSCKKI